MKLLGEFDGKHFKSSFGIPAFRFTGEIWEFKTHNEESETKALFIPPFLITKFLLEFYATYICNYTIYYTAFEKLIWKLKEHYRSPI